MKRNLKKALVGIVAIFAASFILGCKPTVTPNPDGTTNEKPNKDPNTLSTTGNRYDDLELIFNNQTLGTTTIRITRKEWNQMLRNYDYFYKNENCVKFEKYTYEKDGHKWEVPNGGIRLRGNTSRFRPQGKDTPIDETGHRMPNGDWSKDYYNYAANCPDGDYRQSHFKVDFEEFLEGDEEFKMSNCMKGVALKRMDGSCTREIMCYNLFHKFGIWTAPRASHTRVLFEFIEDNGKITKVDFGVYEMFEEVNKQSLKARDEDNNKETKYKNFWKNNKGNLWKCAGGDLTNPNASFGVEDICITEFANDGTPLGWKWDAPTYDLKTNKDKLDSATIEFKGFITELNALPKTANTKEDISEIKSFYEKWFDVEFFLKTYAINILCGMDDDYWGNANNYYLYFDTGSKKATNKVYFIPFDYDNTLGNSISAPGILQNPLDWGRGKNRPLMDRILLVPEYRAMFKRLLVEVSSADGPWNFNDCSAQFIAWGNMVSPYLNSPDIKGCPNIATKDWNGGPGYQNGDWALTYAPNLYDATREAFLNWVTGDLSSITFDLNGGKIKGNSENVLIENPDKTMRLDTYIDSPKRSEYIFTGWTETRDSDDYVTYPMTDCVYARWKKTSEITDLMIYEIEDDSYDGIKIGILNIPGNAARRHVIINDMTRGYTDDNAITHSNIWAYPYLEQGKEYSIYVEFRDANWGSYVKTNTITIKAERGQGEFKLKNEPKFTIENNILKFNPEPELTIDTAIDDNWNDYYALDLSSSEYISWNWLGAKCSGLNFSEHLEDKIVTESTTLKFDLYYRAISEYGEYRYYLYDNGPETNFKIKTKSLILDLNGGNINGSTTAITKTTPIKSQDISLFAGSPKKAGYVLAGWTDTKNGDVLLKTTADAFPYNTIYAKWIELENIEETIKDFFIYEIEDPNYDGIKIKILNKPYKDETIFGNNPTITRYIYVNGNLVSRNATYDDFETAAMQTDVWGFPYTEEGKEYEVYIKYQQDWKNDIKSNTIKIKATSGKGELYTKNKPKFKISQNTITFNPVPELSLTPFGKFLSVIELRNQVDWNYLGDIYGYDMSIPLDLTSIITKTPTSDNMMFHIRYQYNDPDNPTFGHYWHVLYDNNSETYFTMEYAPTISEIEDNSYDGIKIALKNIPSNITARRVYLNDKWVSDTIDNKNAEEWYYPFTEAGKEYKVVVQYLLSDWYTTINTDPIVITAKGGKGEFKLLNTPEFEIENNTLTFTVKPEISIGGKTQAEWETDHETSQYKFGIDIEKNIGSSYTQINLTDFLNDKTKPGDEKGFVLFYSIPYQASTGSEEYRLYIYNWEPVTLFTVE